MTETYYSVGLKIAEGQLPVPAQSGIKNQREADALKGLYPRRLQPTVQKDSVSISGLAREMAAGAGTGAAKAGTQKAETANGITPREAAPRVPATQRNGDAEAARAAAKAAEVNANPVPAGSQTAITPGQQSQAANGPSRGGGFNTVA